MAEAVAKAVDAARETHAASSSSRVSSSTARPPRVALHTGEARLDDDGRYTGPDLRLCHGLFEIANGGQILLSARTAATLGDAALAGVSMLDLGTHRLPDLSSPARVFELRHESDDVAGSLPVRSLDRIPNNLPVHLTSFVGRNGERATVKQLLAGKRLVTLTGVGGAGKTRLAAQVAAEQAQRWSGGVWWVELATVTDPAQVPDAVATALGVLVEPVQGALHSIALQLRDRRMLVCLDNCEHVLDGAAEVAATLLRSCPEASVLATAREPLGVAGETVWQVPSLDEDDAVNLFLERANTVRPGFTLEPSSDATVRTMCARLDGMPLALELAASWLRTLSPQQIEAGLDDRFALLVRGERTADARQQTLAASIDWSHDLLDEAERVLFRRLAVFVGAFTLAAAQDVGAGDPVSRPEVLEILGRLVDKSMVVATERAGESRFRLLETLRAYAADRLREAGEADAARDRHLEHYLATVEAAEPRLEQDADVWRAEMEAEQENLRAALDWGLRADDPTPGRRLAAGLSWSWHLGAHGLEGIEFLFRAIERQPDDRSLLQARLLAGLALVADTASPLDLEYDAAERALEIADAHGDERLRCLCLALAAVGQFFTDFDAALSLNEKAKRSAEVARDAFVSGAQQGLEGIILHLRDRHDEAGPMLEAAAGRLIPRHRGVAATAMGFQAIGTAITGRLDMALHVAEESVRVAEPLQDYHRVGAARSVLATIHGLRGDTDAGLAVLEPTLRLLQGAENQIFVPGLARALGLLHLWRGDLDDAVSWLGREAWSTDRGAETYIAALARPGLASALRRLGRDDEAAEVAGCAVGLARKLGMPRAVADALDEQARLCTDDDPDQAAKLHHDALSVRVEHELRLSYPDSLDALAALAARFGRGTDAVHLAAAGDAARHALGYPRHPAGQAAHDAVLATLRSTLGENGFADAWSTGAGSDLDDAVGYARRTRGARGRPSSGWASLTPTERDVVRQVVEGRNNPEIGARLFMSRSTVKTHLSHVYAKLGVANRTELATLAAAQMTKD